MWCNTIFIYNTSKSVNNIESRFKVSNYKKLNVNEFTSKYTIGMRCSKIKYNNTKYCKLHTKHLIHGDYLEKPSKELCYHFLKDGKYL